MSSPITPIPGPARPASPASGADDSTTFMWELDSSGHAPAIEAGRIGPPPEVLEQMADADAIYEELRLSGRELAFERGARPKRVAIELLDTNGNAVRSLSAVEAVEIAAGGPCE